VTRHSNYAFNVTSALEAVNVPRGRCSSSSSPWRTPSGAWSTSSPSTRCRLSFARSSRRSRRTLRGPSGNHGERAPALREVLRRVLAKVEETGLKKAIFEWALGVGREASRCRQQGGSRGAPRLEKRDRRPAGLSEDPGADGGRLRFFISGGRPCPGDRRVPARHRVLILEGYGLTETSTVTSVNRLERYKFGTVGKALPGTEIRIAADGEILVRGPHIFREYFNDPAATREAIGPDGWFHSGDIGALDERGSSASPTRRRTSSSPRGKNIAPRTWRISSRTTVHQQAFVFGDRKKYLTALLTLAPEEIVPWATKKGSRIEASKRWRSTRRCCS